MKKVKDYFYYKAKKDNYPARSVYKLEEIDKKYHIIKKGVKVLDLGCSPGSWSKYCSSKIGDKGLVVGVDRTELKAGGSSNIRFLQGDVLKIDLEELRQISEGFDVVLSDLAPHTSGIREVDQARSLELFQAAFRIAEEMLIHGGHFICKFFQGPDMKSLLDQMRKQFKWVKTTKPASSRKESFEIYVVGYGRK